MDQLNGVRIHPDEGTAILQGGTFARDLVPTLWDAGYVTSTYSNEPYDMT